MNPNTESVAIERAVLSVLFDGRRQEALGVIEQACPSVDYFADRDHRLIYKVIQRLAADGQQINSATINDTLEHVRFTDLMDKAKPWEIQKRITQGESVLAALSPGTVTEILQAGGSASGLAENCRLLGDHYRQRLLIEAAQGALTAASSVDGRTHGARIADDMINSVSRIFSGVSVANYMDSHMATALAEHDRVQREGDSAPKASWGVPSLDRHVPLRPGRLVTLSALTGRGKTSLAQNVAYSTITAMGRQSVAIVSLEIAGASLASTFIAREIGATREALERGLLMPAQRLAAAEVQHRWVGFQMPVRDTSSACTPRSLEAWVRQYHARSEGRLSVLILDYVQLIDPDTAGQSEYDKITTATRTLKRIALSLNVCVLMLAQMNRKGDSDERRAPKLSDLHGSGSIEKDSDAVVFLHSPEKLKGAIVQIQAQVAKNRYGDLAEVDLSWDRAGGHVFRETDAPRKKRQHDRPASPSEDLFHLEVKGEP